MTAPAVQDLDALLLTPKIHRIGGHELRQAPLPVKKVLAVIRFVQERADLLDRLKLMGKPAAEGGKTLLELLEGDVCTTLNDLLRMLLPGHEQLLTDEWCLDHLSPAHYVLICKTALVQNQLYEVFTRAQGFVTAAVEASLRQKEMPPASSAS